MNADPFIDDFIHGLRRRDVRLWIHNDELSVDAPKGALLQEDVRQLRAHKSAIISFLRRLGQRHEPPPLVPLPKTDDVPLSLAQQRLWIVDQLLGSRAATTYHVPLAMRLHGPLDADALQRALDELVDRHEVLRTTIATKDGMPVQAIAAPTAFALERLDLSAKGADEREAELQRRLAEEVRKPFDVMLGPVIRGCLVRMGADDHVLLIAIHHIACDGWSLQLLFAEAGVLYSSLKRGVGHPLPPVSVQYSDYARWQRSWLRGAVLDGHLSYWTQQLAGVEYLELLLDHPRPPVPAFRGGIHTFVLTSEISAGLRAIAADSAASLFMTTFAIFHVLLSRCSGQRDFPVSTPVAGRNHPGTEQLVGLCVNNLILRVGAAAGMTFRQLLMRVRSVVLEAYAHQDLPYEELVARLRGDSKASPTALSRAAFVVQNASREQARVSELRVEPVQLPWLTAKNELTLTLHEGSHELYGVLQYDRDLFAARTMEQFGERFGLAARQIVADRDVPLDEIDLTLADSPQSAYRYAARYMTDRAYWIANCGDAVPVGLSVGATGRVEPLAIRAEAALDRSLVQALSAVSVSCGVVLRELMLAAAVLYLHKATGIEQLSVGVAVRPLQDTLPVQFSADPAVSVQLLVRQCADRVAAAVLHGSCGSEHIRELQSRNGGNALQFRTVLDVVSEAKSSAQSMPAAARQAELSIRISIDGRIELHGNTRSFERWELEAHVSAFQSLLAQLATADLAQLSPSAISLVDDEHRPGILAWSAGMTTTAPRDALIHELFEQQVEHQPHALAVKQNDVEISYRALNAQANRLTHHLREIGVGPGEFVVIYLERGAQLIAALLATLKNGAAYVPVDPATAAERLKYILGDTRPAAVVTQSRLAHLVPATSTPIVTIDAEAETIAQRPTTNPERPAARATASVAYVIYTSGSTGEPKGVMVDHGNLTNHALWAGREFGLTSRDRALQFASISFDASAEEIFPTLLAGAAIVIRQANVPSALELMQTIGAQRITVLNLPTAYWHAFVEALAGERIETGELRLIVVGGERVAIESLRRWRALAGTRVEWVNTYGPTEATISSTLYRAPADLAGLTDIPIGQPIDNANIYLLDRAGQLVPVGVSGEICIGGAGVARGYLHRDELTAGKFAADPFSAVDTARLYRSGDIARWLPDGNIAYIGRNDDQVKLRGFRIEPGEIEAQLRNCAHMREAAVLVREDSPGDKRLVAYVTCGEQQRASLVEELRGRLQQILPAYMVPSAFIVLDALPMTLNGKLDRQALPAPESGGAKSGAYQEPVGVLEQTLAQIWQDVLRVARVGRQDNFFDLGGSSIGAIQVIGRANQAGIKLTLNAIFEQQTVANLASLLAQAVGSAPTAALSAKRRRSTLQAPERGSIVGRVPFTPIQLEVLQRGDEAARYLISSQVLTCRRAISPEVLHSALRKLTTYHDALRLVVTRSEAGEWSQSIAPAARVAEYTLLECESIESTAQIEAALASAQERLRARIDSAVGPMLQATLIDTGPDSPQLLLLAANHFAVDPISWTIVVHDLQTIYEQVEAGTPVRVPAKGASIKQWGESLIAYAHSPAARIELDHWRALPWERCAELPVETEETTQDDRTQCVTISLDAQQTRALFVNTTQGHGAQINEVLLAALTSALARWCGKTVFAIGMYHHGRVATFDNLDVSRTVGWFSAPVPLLLEAAPHAGINATLADVKRRLRALPNDGVGYGILKYLGQQAQPPEPAVEVLLNHQGTVAGEAPGGLFTTHFDNREYAEVLHEAVLPWKLAVLSNVADDCLCANFISRRYSRPTLQSIADAFRESLRELAVAARTV